MFKKYLTIKVWCIHWLQWLKILPNIWYRCELVLAEIKAKELVNFFKKYSEKNREAKNEM